MENILLPWLVSHLLYGFIYTIKLFTNPIYDRPSWVNRPNAGHFLFSVVFWFTEQSFLIYMSRKPVMIKIIYIVLSYIKCLILLFSMVYLVSTELL